ncbi:MAG: putative porin [Saprospiraceae bacterium]|nr:putative porin [Saprospiraceae bacterium]
MVAQKNYDGFLTFTSNFVIQNDFGGVNDPSVFRRFDSSSNNLTLNPRITEAATRQEKYEFSYLHYFKLNGRRESLGDAQRRQFQASHQVAYKSQLYFFNDRFASRDTNIAAPDSAFYRTLVRDPRGIRFFLTERMIENQFSLSTTRQRRLSADKPDQTTQQNDWFEVGLTHQFSAVNQELGNRNFNNLILRGRWNFTPNDNVKVETQGRFNTLGYNVGDYRLAGELFFNWQKVGSLTVKAVNQLYEPTLLQNQFVLTRTTIWDNNLSKTLETNLSGTLAVPKLGFEATAAYHLLNNYVYFDSTYTPKQIAAPLSIVQLILNQNFKVGVFHLENVATLQNISENVLRLPKIYTKHSLFAEGLIFKRTMLARAGADARFNTAWAAPEFQPATGQFFVPNGGEIPTFLSLDVFLSFKVRSFRFFAKMENMLGEWGFPDAYFQTFRYPIPERVFRFGIGWRLLN